jgi:hypothetical protein
MKENCDVADTITNLGFFYYFMQPLIFLNHSNIFLNSLRNRAVPLYADDNNLSGQDIYVTEMNK